MITAPQQLDGGMHEYQRDPDGKCGVGNVESGPVMAARMKVDEIDHMPVQNPVGKVSGRSAQDQGKGRPVIAVFHDEEGNEEGCTDGQHDKESIAQRLKQAESRTHVFYVYEVEHGKKMDYVERGNAGSDKVLCVLVNDENNQGKHEIRIIPFFHLPKLIMVPYGLWWRESLNPGHHGFAAAHVSAGLRISARVRRIPGIWDI